MGQAPPPPPPSQPPPPPPPPPPHGEAQGAPGASPTFSVADAIRYGWNAMGTNLGPMLQLTIVIIAVNVGINLVGQAIDSAGVQIAFAVIGWVVGLLLAFGLIRASLAVTRGERPEVALLFQSEGFGPYLLASILFGIGVAIGFALCIVPGIIVGIVYMFYGYVISERGEGIGPVDALSRAAEISKGHRMELFGFAIVLVLINLVGALLCGVGLLFTYGITALAIAYAYKALTGQPVVESR